MLTKVSPQSIKVTGWYWVLLTFKSKERWTVAHYDSEIKEFRGVDRILTPLAVDPRIIRRFEIIGSKQATVTNAIAGLKVEDEGVFVEELVIAIWGTYDAFVRRSFDVILAHAKKQFPDRQFKTVRGFVKRIV